MWMSFFMFSDQASTYLIATITDRCVIDCHVPKAATGVFDLYRVRGYSYGYQ